MFGLRIGDRMFPDKFWTFTCPARGYFSGSVRRSSGSRSRSGHRMHRVRSEVTSELLATQWGDDGSRDTTEHHEGLLTLRLTASIHSCCHHDDGDARHDAAAVAVDADGDLDVPRRSRASKVVILLETLLETDCTRTGAQLWRAALLLADWVVASTELFRDATVLELGCGIGFLSIVAARTARLVVATDVDCDALRFASRNHQHNAAETRGSIRWRQFDWRSRFLDCSAPNTSTTATIPAEFQWHEDDASLLESTDIILASDVFYDDELTDVFLDTLYDLMRQYPQALAVVSAEQRVVFSAVTLTEISLGVDTFQSRLCRHDPTVHHRTMSRNAVTCDACCDGNKRPRFVATSIPIDTIPTAFLDYKRESTLQLWTLQAVVY